MNNLYSINFLAREQRRRRWIRRSLTVLVLALALGAMGMVWWLAKSYPVNEASMLNEVELETIPIEKTRDRLMAITNTFAPIVSLADVLHPSPISALITNVVSALKDDALHLRLIEFKLIAACKWEVETMCSIPDAVGNQQMVDTIAGYVSNRLAGVSIEARWPAWNKSLSIVFRGEWPVIRKPYLALPQSLDDLWKVVVEHRKAMLDYKQADGKQSYIQACVDALNNVPPERRGEKLSKFVVGIRRNGVDNLKTAITEAGHLASNEVAVAAKLDVILREWDSVSKKPWQFKRMRIYKQRLRHLRTGRQALRLISPKLSVIESNMAAIKAGADGWLSFDDYLKERKMHALYELVLRDPTWSWTIAEVATPAAGPFTPIKWNLDQSREEDGSAAGERKGSGVGTAPTKGIGQPVPLAEVMKLIKTIESQSALASIREASFVFDQDNQENVRQAKISGILPAFDPAVREKMRDHGN